MPSADLGRDRTPSNGTQPPLAAGSAGSGDENSGLHDIKAMAQSARARNSRRITAVNAADDDVLASSSAGLRAVALPDPSRSGASSVSLPAVSLPSLDMSPSSVPTRPSGRIASATHQPIASATAVEQLAALATATPVRATAAPTKSKAPLLIGGAVLLVGAIGGIAYVATRPSSTPAPTVATTAPIAAPTPAVGTPPAVATAPAVVTTPLVAETPAIAPVAPTTPTADDKAVVAKGEDPKEDKTTKLTGETPMVAKVEPKVEPKGEVKGDTTPKGDGTSIDDMLAAAGGLDKTDDGSDRLAKKALTSDDIKTAMGARRSAAQACYGKFSVAGNVGVKLSVDPSGKVKKASASGPLAGTPTADCVLAAARDASFPPWDGSPQTVNFSYTISD